MSACSLSRRSDHSYSTDLKKSNDLLEQFAYDELKSPKAGFPRSSYIWCLRALEKLPPYGWAVLPAGQPFWGCETFRRCQATRLIVAKAPPSPRTSPSSDGFPESGVAVGMTTRRPR